MSKFVSGPISKSTRGLSTIKHWRESVYLLLCADMEADGGQRQSANFDCQQVHYFETQGSIMQAVD